MSLRFVDVDLVEIGANDRVNSRNPTKSFIKYLITSYFRLIFLACNVLTNLFTLKKNKKIMCNFFGT